MALPAGFLLLAKKQALTGLAITAVGAAASAVTGKDDERSSATRAKEVATSASVSTAALIGLNAVFPGAGVVAQAATGLAAGGVTSVLAGSTPAADAATALSGVPGLLSGGGKKEDESIAETPKEGSHAYAQRYRRQQVAQIIARNQHTTSAKPPGKPPSFKKAV